MTTATEAARKAGISTAVILAAGRGRRIAPHIGDRPKGFIRLGAHPIIEESARSLRAAGIRHIIVVTGFMKHFYEQWAAGADRVETVENPYYGESGSMYSLYCARHLIREDFLLLESDLIYEPRAVAETLAHPAPDVLLISGPTGAGDEVFVAADRGRLTAMSKDRRRLPSVAGELVGITKISLPFYETMLETMMPRLSETRHLDYEADGLVAAAQRMPMHCHLIGDLVWTEIDDIGHLERARSHIYPRLHPNPES